MSRLKSSPTAPAKRDGRLPGGVGITSQDEICPVCKTSRYMKPEMRLLVNPVCYHKMCESCVDRIFSHGPAQCPIPGCPHTLRKNRFRMQTFEDLKVEREVDVRKRVAAVFNRREEEFETLRDYNDYLNDVEDITFNLIEGIDLEETEKRFLAYEKAHKDEIKENATLAVQESMSFDAQRKAERERLKKGREAARREEAEEKREVAANRRDLLRRLESGQDPEQIEQQQQQQQQGVALKKRLNRQAAEQRQQRLQAADDSRNGSSNLVIKGLKAKTQAQPEAPIDPFGGLSFEHSYYSLQDDYTWDVLRQARQDVLIGAGGYSVSDFTSRALCEAFSGLGVMVADEAAERERTQQGAKVEADPL